MDRQQYLNQKSPTFNKKTCDVNSTTFYEIDNIAKQWENFA